MDPVEALNFFPDFFIPIASIGGLMARIVTLLTVPLSNSVTFCTFSRCGVKPLQTYNDHCSRIFWSSWVQEGKETLVSVQARLLTFYRYKDKK